MLTVILIATTFIPTTLSCVASGICGGLGPCMSPIPPVAPGCAGGMGCGAGYSCGSYGCFRARARVHGTGTLRSEGQTVPIGVQRFNQVRRQQNRDPNAMFMECCEQRGLPDACLQKCTFNTYTKQSLTRMYFKQDACPLAASAEIQFCAAQGRDHRDCCARNGVSTTSAGEKCLTFCDQRPGNVTLLDFSYVSCYDRFENMKACFWHNAVQSFDYKNLTGFQDQIGSRPGFSGQNKSFTHVPFSSFSNEENMQHGLHKVQVINFGSKKTGPLWK